MLPRLLPASIAAAYPVFCPSSFGCGRRPLRMRAQRHVAAALPGLRANAALVAVIGNVPRADGSVQVRGLLDPAEFLP